jgi:hypothetical protein
MQVDVSQHALFSGVAASANFLRRLGAMRSPWREEVACRAGSVGSSCLTLYMVWVCGFLVKNQSKP